MYEHDSSTVRSCALPLKSNVDVEIYVHKISEKLEHSKSLALLVSMAPSTSGTLGFEILTILNSLLSVVYSVLLQPGGAMITHCYNAAGAYGCKVYRRWFTA